MPSESTLPQLRGLAVSKPGREAWLYEELYDALVAASLSSRVESTRFKGVFLIYSDASPREIAESIAEYKTHTATRVLLASMTLARPRREELERAVRELLEASRVARVRLILKPRGLGEGLVSERDIASMLELLGARVDPGSRAVLAVESVDDLFLITLGTTRSCGFKCILVSPS
ncbi:MAG: hypothetical protein QXS85_05020 [Acidilobaceae archaeon]